MRFNSAGVSTGGWWLAPGIVTLRAPGILAASASAMSRRFRPSRLPTTTSVGALICPSRSAVGGSGDCEWPALM
jgi:hypothetical protein